MLINYAKDGTPISIEVWSELMMDPGYARVGLDRIGDVEVSTVWIGLDYSFGPPGPPLFFETMVFGSEGSEETYRYSSEEEALAGHERVVAGFRLLGSALEVPA